MFSLFKKPAPPAELTFKTRVERFWAWYAEVAPRFFQVIEAKRCPDLAPEVSAKVDELLPGFAWVFGPGANQQGHSFTLSGEGVIHRQLLTQYWLSRAPTLPGWTFYSARQAGLLDGHTINVGDRVFAPREFWVTPTLDLERESIDISVWHPFFADPKARHPMVLYLFLDELLGEYGTEQYLGKIEFSDAQLADAIPLLELRDFIDKTRTEQQWKKFPPGECYTGYRCKEPHDRFLRGDIIAGTTANFRLVREYGVAEGELDDPIKNTGADFVFVAFDGSILPDGKQVAARGEIEDALQAALDAAQSGRLIGGALGTRSAYIDLLIYDGAASVAIVQQVLRERRLPAGTEIHFFAKEKRGHRVVL